MPNQVVGPDGALYYQGPDGQWYRQDPVTGGSTQVAAPPGGAPSGAPPAGDAPGGPSDPFESPGAVGVQEGLDIILAEMETALRLAESEAKERIAAVNAAAQAEATRIAGASAERIAQLGRDTELELQDRNAELEQALLDKRITHEQFLQDRELAQSESQFARNLAQREIEAERDYELRTLQEEHAYELGQAELELAQFAEVRMERELMADLAANPADFVKYEYYKRSLGEPTALDGLAQQFAAGENLLGQAYPDAPPAYSDETLQQVGAAAFGQEGSRALYNPNMGGIGAFGVTIPGVQDISRSEFLGLDETELAMATSFIRAGTELPSGERVGGNPADYFRNLERSFIPTLEGAGGRTQYQ